MGWLFWFFQQQLVIVSELICRLEKIRMQRQIIFFDKLLSSWEFPKYLLLVLLKTIEWINFTY